MIICNGIIEASISEMGAELTSLRRVDGQFEYIWQADARYWARHAPMLFPIVGKVWDGHFQVDGRSYPMSQHGFARDSRFIVLCAQSDCVTLALESDADSLARYPFPFRIEAEYRLVDCSSEVSWRVKNTGEKPMFFQIGAHPGFNLPDYDPTDFIHGYFRMLSGGEPVCNLIVGKLTEDGYRSDDAGLVSLDSDAFLPVTPGLFANDALVLEEFQTDCVELYDKYGAQLLSLECPAAPVWGLWSPPAKNAPFVCIEPWMGRCDAAGFDGPIENREYINTLEAGRTYPFEYRITI